MKELIKKLPFFENIKSSEILGEIAVHIVLCIMGFAVTAAKIAKTVTPFGVCFLAAAPFNYIPSVAVGTFLGYFFAAFTGVGFRYVAAVSAVLAIKLLLSGFKATSSSPAFTCLISFLSLSVTAPVMSEKAGALLLVAESVTGTLWTYFFGVSFRGYSHIKAGFSSEEFSGILAVLAVLVAGLGSINLFGIYLYRIIGIFLMLSAARYGGAQASTAAGISAAISIFFASGEIEACIIAVVTGLTAGIFRSYGKWVLSLTATAAALVGMIIADNTFHPAVFAEMLIASAVFLVLPKSFGKEMGKLLSYSPKITVQSDLKKMVKLKLLDASDALLGVKNTVNEVSNRLSLITSPDFSGMIKEIEESSCAGCRNRIFCWETKSGQTNEALMRIIEKRKNNTDENIDGEFMARCLRYESFKENALTVYARYEKSLAAENRAREVREVVSEQFDGISLLLKETANEIENGEKFDRTTALEATKSLKNLGIISTEAACLVDRFGRRYLKIKAAADRDTVINKMQVMKMLSVSVGTDFSVPTVNRDGQNVIISITEAPRYKIETGVYQISAGNASMCGDSYKFTGDGHGRFFAVLSDGMGTGGAAAVDSALSSGLLTRLIKSGISLESAVKIINSSMLYKSTYESSATLDVVCIDLFSGKALLFKAGAAPTLIKHGGRTVSFNGKSLPIGIISEVEYEKATVNLRNRDVLLMMSDGAAGESIEWIKREVENCGDISAQSLSENIALAARRRRSDGHEDDITVISLIVENAM